MRYAVILALLVVAGCAQSPWQRAQGVLKFSDVTAERCLTPANTFNEFRQCIEQAIATRGDLTTGEYAGYAARYRIALAQIDAGVTAGNLTDLQALTLLNYFAYNLRQEFLAQAAHDENVEFARQVAGSQALMHLGNSLQTYGMHQQTLRAMQSVPPSRPITCSQMGAFTNCF